MCTLSSIVINTNFSSITAEIIAEELLNLALSWFNSDYRTYNSMNFITMNVL